MGRDQPWERRTLDDQGSVLLGGGAAKRRRDAEPIPEIRPLASPFVFGPLALLPAMVISVVVVDGSHHGRHPSRSYHRA